VVSKYTKHLQILEKSKEVVEEKPAKKKRATKPKTTKK